MFPRVGREVAWRVVVGWVEAEAVPLDLAFLFLLFRDFPFFPLGFPLLGFLFLSPAFGDRVR